jgi:plasmid replication initiation protein
MGKTKTGRTMRVAHMLKLQDGGEMAMAAELIHINTPKNEELSLLARRTLLLMLEAAAGEAWKAQFHCIAKQDLRGAHASLDRMRPALRELLEVSFCHGELDDEKAKVHLFNLLQEIVDDPASAFIEFRFTERVCKLLGSSDIYARLSRAAIIRFQSAYALRMYEVGSALYARNDPCWRGTIPELRTLLQVPEATYANTNLLFLRVLEPARTELGQLAEFDLSWELARKGRKIIGIELCFTAKPGRAALAAAEENARHSSGRAARRDGTAEEIVSPAVTKGLIANNARLLRVSGE